MNSARAARTDWSDAFPESPEAEQSIPERFAQTVARYGDHIAVSANSAEWTYAELDERSNALAVQILDRAEAKRPPVALLMEHGAALIAAILAVLKSGKIYLALDPSHPIERLSAMLTDSRSELLIADRANVGLAGSLAAAELSILPVADDFVAPSAHTNLLEVSRDAGARPMYMAGSTGTPKVVC